MSNSIPAKHLPFSTKECFDFANWEPAEAMVLELVLINKGDVQQRLTSFLVNFGE